MVILTKCTCNRSNIIIVIIVMLCIKLHKSYFFYYYYFICFCLLFLYIFFLFSLAIGTNTTLGIFIKDVYFMRKLPRSWIFARKIYDCCCCKMMKYRFKYILENLDRFFFLLLCSLFVRVEQTVADCLRKQNFWMYKIHEQNEFIKIIIREYTEKKNSWRMSAIYINFFV